MQTSEKLAWIGVIVCALGLVTLIPLQIQERYCLSAYHNYHPQFGLFTQCTILVNGIQTPTDIVKIELR